MELNEFRRNINLSAIPSSTILNNKDSDFVEYFKEK
jgi:hypothetical protein